MWASPLEIEQTFPTPQIHRQLEGPNYLKQYEMAKMPVLIIVLFLENVKYESIYHKLK